MPHLTDAKVKGLEMTAAKIRVSLMDMLLEAGSGHSAGSLGMADIFTLLFFEELRHDPKKPNWKDRDRVALSNGHICPVLYATMAHAGYFPIEELSTLRKFGSRLQGHPHREFLPMLDTSSGALGEGLGQAIGMALANRIDEGRSSKKFFYCLMGDGELNEGSVWEAAMLAAREQLHSIIVIIDRNNIQIDGFTEDVMPLEPLYDKWRDFGWHVIESDGHSFDAMHDAIGQAQAVFETPSVIIAHTTPGKGVPFMENKFEWHGRPPKRAEAKAAIKEIRSLGGRIERGHH